MHKKIIATTLVALAAAAAPGAGPARADSCPAGKFDRAGTCTSYAEAAKQIRLIVRSTMAEQDARGVLIRVQVGSRTLVNRGFGESLPGVPATSDMHFRPGSMTVPMLTTTLLALQDKGKLSLDDKLAKWLPQYPNADRVTLRMLASSTSGYPDYIQGNEPFQRIQESDPFRVWTEGDLMRYAFAMPVPCEPATCFHYAHTNFVLLGQVIRKVTGRSITEELTERFLSPLRLRDTRVSRLAAIPEPVFHVYTTERGVFEDSTYWSPSWGLGEGLVMTSNPQFNGYVGLVAYMRERGISVTVENSFGPNAGRQLTSPVIFGRVTQYLTPDRALTF